MLARQDWKKTHFHHHSDQRSPPLYPGSREPSIASNSCTLFLLYVCLKPRKGSADTANHFHIPSAPFINTALGSAGDGKSKLEDLSWMSGAPERKHRHNWTVSHTLRPVSHTNRPAILSWLEAHIHSLMSQQSLTHRGNWATTKHGPIHSWAFQIRGSHIPIVSLLPSPLPL